MANLANHCWFPTFHHPILKMSRDINKESKQAEICQSFTRQKILIRNSPKLCPAKQLFYTVHYSRLHMCKVWL